MDLSFNTTTQQPFPDHFPLWLKKLCPYTDPLPELATRIAGVYSHLQNTNLTRQDPTDKTQISLPLSYANTVAYTMSAQHLSHHIETRGPIDCPPNDEDAQQHQAAVSLDTVLPFLASTTLENQGFNRSFLKDVSENKTYTASGSLLNETASLKTKRRDIHLMDKHSLHRLSTATWNVVKLAFDVSNIDEDDLSPHVHGLRAYQLIIMTFSNRVLHAKHKISDRILALNSRTTPTVDALLELFRDTKALTMLHRIIQGEDIFFVKSTSLLPKVLDYMQSSANIRTISPSIQGEYLKSLRFFHGIAQQNESILATAVLNRLTPILLKSSTSRDSVDSLF